MRLCKALRNSSANFGQRATIVPYFHHRRYFADDRSQKHGDHEKTTSPTRKKNNIAHPAIDWENAFKIDSGDKTVETAVGDLPLSPIMDPAYWEATRRHQVPKAKPGKALNSVERQLRANPFAMALATPVRKCIMTRVRLPNFFLQDFNVVSHPETGHPWLIPQSLMPSETSAKEKIDAEKTMEVESGESEEPSENIEPKSEYLQENSTSTTSEKEPIYGPAAYVLARNELLRAFADKQSSFTAGPKRLVGSSPRYRNLGQKVVWRKDMDTYVRDLMRQGIVSELLYLCDLCTEKGRHYIAKCYGWEDVQYKHKGSVLWFENPVVDEGMHETRDKPGPFATFDIPRTSFQGGSYTESVAVFNMPVLLGHEHVSRLKETQALRNGFQKDGSIFMLAGRRTVGLQAKLWKIQGYLADFRD